MDVSDEMIQDFFVRTERHMALVRKWGEIVYNNFGGGPGFRWEPDFPDLRERVEEHDRSKFGPEEGFAYILINWEYRTKSSENPFKIPPEMRERVSRATHYHISHNRHHPEFFARVCDVCDGMGVVDASYTCGECFGDGVRPMEYVPREARSFQGRIDATRMLPIDIAEMVCDWAAMSEELGTSLREWADKTVRELDDPRADGRWEFDDQQIELIYRVVGVCEAVKK